MRRNKAGDRQAIDLDILPAGISEFHVAISETVLDRIEQRIRSYQWPSILPSNDWKYGVELSFLRRLTEYWVEAYDWRAQEGRINQQPGYSAVVAGSQLFFFWLRPSTSIRKALLILPGWPYSCVSYLTIARRLSNPEEFGGDATEGVHVIIPSFPGFAFSEPPSVPIGPRALGERMNTLMNLLGFERYMVHGGDIGANAASWLAFDHPESVVALSSTFVIVRQQESEVGGGIAVPELTSAELTYLREEQAAVTMRSAYALAQQSEPISLGLGFRDSPIGLAAWMVAKFYHWSDLQSRSFEQVFSMDQLITEIMMYAAPDCADTSLWIYAGFKEQEVKAFPPNERVQVPTWIAAFPDPLLPPPPRALVERSYNVTHWTDMDRGGHFPFYEEPGLLLLELQKFVSAHADCLPTEE